MSGCKCNGASTQPCRYCQQETWCDLCHGTEETCDCDYCDACGNTADHDTAHHEFQQDELWCWEKFGCLEQGDHYHTDEINAITKGK